MRIVQLIDSLDAGGAERMAINYANALADKIEFSGLITTRKEGQLLNQIKSNVSYLFLRRKNIIDLKAAFKLRLFVKRNKVTIVHAHGTSFFMAILLKMVYPPIKIIWHDHYGDSEYLNLRPTNAIRWSAIFFEGIIAVNNNLKTWSEDVLKIKNVIYLPNFAAEEKKQKEETILQGESGKRIVCLANLREQKNHFFLLEVAKLLKISHGDWTFHLVGKDIDDDYSKVIVNLIKKYDLTKNVFIYGSKQDISNILKQCEIGILTSKSEGLPMAILEYGLNKKAVVVTDVGEIHAVIKNSRSGFVVKSNDVQLFYSSLVAAVENQPLRVAMGQILYREVIKNYSETAVLHKYMEWLQRL